MNISQVNIRLTGQDVLSIINEFVKIQGLKLEKIVIEDGMTIKGSFHKGITINFSAKVEIVKCENNKVFLRLAKVKILKLGIFRILRSFALKQLSKVCEQFGITNKKEVAIIDINKVLKDVPYVNINVDDIYIKKNELYVEVNNVEVSIAGTLIKEKNDEEVEENKTEDIEDLQGIRKVRDNYSAGREIVINRLPENAEEYKDYLFILPDLVSLIYRLLKDKRVPVKTKLVMSSAIAYVMVPSDLIPNNIPFIGVVDDIGVVFFALNKVINDVPLSVIVENWEGSNDIIVVIKKGIEYLTNFTAAKNVENLYEFVEELSTL